MSTLSGKVVMITGATSGIGKALMEAAITRGAYVAVCGRNTQPIMAQYVSLPNVLVHRADVSNEEDCRSFVEAVVTKWQRIDVLICNAGISMRALFEKTDLSVIRELMDVNFWGTVYCSKYALPYLRKSRGVIAGVSSIAGYRGLPARTGYSASKFAVQGFLEALRTELLHTGTHVMWVSPGFTASNIRNTARTANGGQQEEAPLDNEKLMTAEQCAGIILTAIEKRKRTVTMTLQGKVTVWLNRLLPSLADKLVYNHFLKERDSPLKDG